MDRDRLEKLLARHFDGSLAESERNQLQELLQDNPEARGCLAKASMDEVLLGEVLGAPVPEAPSMERRRSYWRYGFAIAAAAIVVLTVWLAVWRKEEEPGLVGQALRAITDSGELEPVDRLVWGRDLWTEAETDLSFGSSRVR